MPLIKLSDAWKQAANWVAGTVLAFVRDQSAIFVDTVADVNDNDLEQARWIYVKTTSSLYRMDLTSVASDDGFGVLRDSIGRRYLRVAASSFETAAASSIADVGNAVNTAGKVQGRAVYDTTNHRLMIADGPLAADAWYVADGSASVTPA